MKNLLLFITLTSLFSFSSCDSPLTKDVNRVKGVPKNAVLLFESDNIGEALNNLEENSLWSVIEKEESIKLIATQLRSLSQYLNKNNIEVLDKKAVFSLHNVGVKSFDYLILLKQSDISPEDFSKFDPHKKSSKIYDSANIVEYSLPVLSSPLYVSNYQGLLIISRNIILLENSIRQLNSKESLMDNSNFSSIYKSINNKEDFNLLINIPKLRVVDKFADNIDFVKWTTNFSDWMELDISPDADEIFCSGITSTNDSIGNFLGIFSNQKAQRITVDELLPSGTAFSVVYGFENFSQYYRRYQDYLQKHGELKKFELNQQKHQIKRAKLFDTWIDNQIGFAALRSDNKAINYNDLVLIKSKEASLAKEALKLISDKSILNFRGFTIHKTVKKEIFKDYLGESFRNLQAPYYTIIDDVVILSDNRKNIQNIISDYIDGRNMESYHHFKNLKEDLAYKSNIIFYFKNPDFSEFLTAIFPDLKPLISDNIKELSKYKSGAFQFTYENGNAYTNILARQSYEVENEVKPIWELEFDKDLYPEISTLQNHYNNNKEIAVQDKNNILYLISTSGKILWSKQLDSKILGKIQQVDLYKNRKLQMAFNTEANLYILDRNGKNIDNFPKKLPWKSSAPIGIFDYSKSRNYRFVVPMGKQIRMYDNKGKTISGFKFKKSSSTINKAPQHFRVKGKDYIVLSTASGKIYVLDRRGSNRINVKNNYPLGVNKFYLIEESSLSKSRIITNTKKGELLSIFFNSVVDISKIDKFDSETFYIKKGDQTVSLSKNIVKWSNKSSTEIFEIEDNNFSEPKVFSWNKIHYLVVGSVSSNKVYLFDSNMDLQKGFPVYGQIVGRVADYNRNGDVNFPVIVNDDKGNLKMFSIN
ncbi:MAG: DUF3352 domain-containing protein [Bacteroidota bacterium]